MNVTRLVLPVAVALTLSLACGGGSDATNSPTSSAAPTTATSTPSASSTSSADSAVLDAYAQYWQVYSDALYNLDSSQLQTVMTGARLQRALDEVSSLQQQGRAVKIDVQNQPVVIGINGDTAMVFDEYQNRSSYIDPVTKDPLSSPGQAETLRDSVTLTFVDGIWKVTDSVRQTG